MAAKTDKVIVTNTTALKTKYGAGYASIDKAVKNLVTADKGRGLTTVVVDISDAAGMTKLNGKSVATPGNTQQVKAAVDAIYRALVPDYLVILGAVDIVPHQDLRNPAYEAGADDDQFAPGDLPYACDHPYSQNPADFTSPTRVVGRLPDITAETNPDYLCGLLNTAANFKSRPATDYFNYLGVSASVWVNSTTLSLQSAFGSAGAIQISPPSGPNWTPAQFQALSHFFNCHGAPADPHFYGQKGTNYPVSHDAAIVAQHAVEGTVVAAECCYGAELYAPSIAGGQAGICNSYLLRKAYGFFGSSTIAYGPANGNANADLICQYFFKNLLTGASIGRAALQARHDFIRSAAALDAVDLKTLAQFSLMADPSVLPVQSSPVDHTLKTALSSKGVPHEMGDIRTMRRERLRRYGLAIGSAAATTHRDEKDNIPTKVRKAFKQILEGVGGTPHAFHSHTVDTPVQRSSPKSTTKAFAAGFAPTSLRRVYVAYSVLPSAHFSQTKTATRPLVAVIARESDEGLVFRTVYSR